ncbi:MAG: MBL fold metallo-hydrolase [Candidatus Magasanikbacteria bacterium]|nr:MBL fold metallo-hydrolase [Candidatus Magasanikbacteria bacterium]
MNDEDGLIKIDFWGVRGSRTVTEPEIITGVGGYTSCVQVTIGDKIFVVDGGSGATNFGNWLFGELAKREELTLHMLFTHKHIDHWCGLQFFGPLFASKKLTFEITGSEENVEKFHKNVFDGDTFPVDVSMLAARVHYTPIESGAVIVVPSTYRGQPENIVIEALSVNHPGGCLGYRFTFRGKSLAVIFDHEEVGPDAPEELQQLERNLVELLRGVDLGVIECQYHEFEDEPKARYMKGWGHERVSHLIEVLKSAQVKEAILTHHDPAANPALVARIANAVHEGSGIPTTFACERMSVVL